MGMVTMKRRETMRKEEEKRRERKEGKGRVERRVQGREKHERED